MFKIYPDSQKDGKYITVNGPKIWVVIFGQGYPIILIPGERRKAGFESFYFIKMAGSGGRMSNGIYPCKFDVSNGSEK